MKDFEILFKEGHFVGGKHTTLKIWKIDPAKYPRRKYGPMDLLVGFAVGKKVHKSAVKRNKIKRQMREVVRLMLKDGKIKNGFMMSFIAKPGALTATYDDIAADMKHLLKKARVV